MISRKELLKWLAAVPVAGTLAGNELTRTATGAKLIRPRYRRDYLTELGVRQLINARGTFTTLTGSLMEPEVIEAINYTAQTYVPLPELMDKVGERIAEMLECEGAMVTAGAASALTLGTAGIITGTDQEKIRELPNLPGPQLEVIMQSTHRFGYDHAVRNCGVKIVEVDSARDMERNINSRTVMALHFNAAREHLMSHEEFVAICQRNNIPSFIDCAADVPPRENLFKYKQMGFDLVTFSGGKGIRGPQSAGLLFGRKDLIEAARLNHLPYGNSIGRGMKVNKEEIVGMMVALEIYLTKDHEAEWADWLQRVETIQGRVTSLDGVQAEQVIPEGPSNVFPGCRITWQEENYPITYGDMIQALRYGHPSIEAAGGRDDIYVNVAMMRAEEADVVGRRIREELEASLA
ncbi:MAG: aminotransferase class V-fold PLP-dependent enzyme [Balneolaceae bacterium]